MKINSINKTNTQFNGRLLQKRAHISLNTLSNIGGILNQDKIELQNLTKDATLNRWSFFKVLVDKYNSDNGLLPEDKKEDSTLVNKIYDYIKNPNELENRLVNNYNGNISSLYRIFTAAGGEHSRIKFAYKVLAEVIGPHQNETYKDLIPELLESEVSSKFVNDLDEYKSYLKLNRSNENAVTNLTQMVKDDTYNRAKYDRELEIRNIKKKVPVFRFRYIYC